MKRQEATPHNISAAKYARLWPSSTLLPEGGAFPSGEEARMESVVAALVTGVLTLAGVLVHL